MRALTLEEVQLLEHMCEHGWTDGHVDRNKLASQIQHLTAKPGCEVENCPCLDFDYRGTSTWSDEFAKDAATSETQTVLVMDIRDSEWQANLFVCGGIISWLEFSSFGDEYPTQLPKISELH